MGTEFDKARNGFPAEGHPIIVDGIEYIVHDQRWRPQEDGPIPLIEGELLKAAQSGIRALLERGLHHTKGLMLYITTDSTLALCGPVKDNLAGELTVPRRILDTIPPKPFQPGR